MVFKDEEFADLFPEDGRPGLSPGRLALVSVPQFAENLSDRAAVNAVRTRIDWKYALGPELDDPGFDHSVLCEFRARLAEADAADRLLQVMLHRLTEAGLLTSGGRQRTDTTPVLAAVRTLSRLELVGESLRAALEQLAQADPDWLVPLVEPEWDKRYGRKAEIGKVPGGKAAVTALAEATGRDGHKVLAAARAAAAPPRLRTLTQVEILRRVVWVHHYYGDARGRPRRRDGHTLPPASLRFDSPYDTDAHYCVKHDTAWSGYRTQFHRNVHLRATGGGRTRGHYDRPGPGRQAHRPNPRRPRGDRPHSRRARGRRRLHQPRADRTRPAGARHHPALPGRTRPQPAGQKRSRVRQGRLVDRLGAPPGHLPPGQPQPRVAAPAHQRTRLHPDQVRQGHLSGLPRAPAVHRRGQWSTLTRAAAHPRTA
ncbi:transposase [Streptomyces sp. SID12488]|nr:transposase [Streptomyces sp. SID12488]